MKKLKIFFRSPMGTTFLFMLAILFLMTGTIGGVRAAPQIFNREFFYGGLELDEIGVTLLENGERVHSRDYNKEKQIFDLWSNDEDNQEKGKLLGTLLTDTNNKVKLGYSYKEELSVKNSGKIPEYVRVIVYKYWIDDATQKRIQAYDDNGDEVLNDLIKLEFVENNGWIIDKSSNTKERTVLYYQTMLDTNSDSNTTPPFTSTLTIDGKIIDYADKKTITDGNTVTWIMDGKRFVIEAEVDAVQNHNARAAVKSAWGLTNDDISRLKLDIK